MGSWGLIKVILDSFESDPEGKEILRHYLKGEGKFFHRSGGTWGEYMMRNALLTSQCRLRVRKILKGINCGKLEKGASGKVSETFHAEVENGEGVVGYNYLHGTNAKVGDFKITGTWRVKSKKGRCCTIQLILTYEWNDVIDPNPKYFTDKAKNLIAEVITLGGATPYTLKIDWTEICEVKVCEGRMLGLKGWPLIPCRHGATKTVRIFGLKQVYVHKTYSRQISTVRQYIVIYKEEILDVYQKYRCVKGKWKSRGPKHRYTVSRWSRTWHESFYRYEEMKKSIRKNIRATRLP